MKSMSWLFVLVERILTLVTELVMKSDPFKDSSIKEARKTFLINILSLVKEVRNNDSK